VREHSVHDAERSMEEKEMRAVTAGVDKSPSNPFGDRGEGRELLHDP